MFTNCDTALDSHPKVPTLPMPYNSPQTFPLFTHTIEFTTGEKTGAKRKNVRPFFFLSFFPLVLPMLKLRADNFTNAQDNPIYILSFLM